MFLFILVVELLRFTQKVVARTVYLSVHRVFGGTMAAWVQDSTIVKRLRNIGDSQLTSTKASASVPCIAKPTLDLQDTRALLCNGVERELSYSRKPFVPSWTRLSIGLLAAFFVTASSWCQSPLPSSETKMLLASNRPAATGNAPAAPAPVTTTPVMRGPVAVAPASGIAPQSASMFDALASHIKPVTTTVEVYGTARELDTSRPEPFQTGGQEVMTTAGDFGDISRFLQMFPGVVATSDLSNEVVVRGGHPMENLFLVDGIEVPNINHMATLGTTGGFGPMIDSGVIQGLKMYTGGYDARYPERLSSVTEIQTLDQANSAEHAEADLGIQGFGGLGEKRLRMGDLLVSAHYGLLDVMNSVGISGLPSYTNEMARLRHSDDSGNRLTILHVAGWDSLVADPCATDPEETTSIASQYSGWRETTGAEFQHIHSVNSFVVASVSDSEQIEHIHQQDQIIGPASVNFSKMGCPIPASVFQPTPVYMEDSNNAFSTGSLRYEWSGSRISLSAGSAAWLQRPHYDIDQPIGAFSPYSVAPIRTDSTSFASNFSTGETGTFAQLTMHPNKALELSAGGRLQTFAFGSHTTLTPRASVRYSLGESVSLHAAYASYAQLPPYVYMMSYQQNRSMLPMRSTHEIVGMDLGFVRSSAIRIEAYNKQYSDTPASTEYPSVTLHDMVDMLGQQFVWLPMNSGGNGTSSGIELSDLTRIHSRLTVRGSLAYSRAKFAGLDHVMRPSNFDFPWILNIAALEHLGHGYEVSTRYGYASGRPYTPYDDADSTAQDRPIYDVSSMNIPRAPYFARLDAQLNKDAVVHGLHLEIYAGVNNILDRSNFLSYVWLPRYKKDCKTALNPVDEINQMPIFPNFGLRYIFR